MLIHQELAKVVLLAAIDFWRSWFYAMYCHTFEVEGGICERAEPRYPGFYKTNCKELKEARELWFGAY